MESLIGFRSSGRKWTARKKSQFFAALRIIHKRKRYLSFWASYLSFRLHISLSNLNQQRGKLRGSGLMRNTVKVTVKLFSISQDHTWKNVAVCQQLKHLIGKRCPSLFEQTTWSTFENDPEVSEQPPLSIKKTLHQQLMTFCIWKDEDAHTQETIGRKGRKTLWKLCLQQWSPPRKNKNCLRLFLLRMRLSQRPKQRRKIRCYLVTEESVSENTRTRPSISVILCVQLEKWMREEKLVCHDPKSDLSLLNTFPVMLSKWLKLLLPRWLLIANPPASLSLPLSQWTQVEIVFRIHAWSPIKGIDSENTSVGIYSMALVVMVSFGGTSLATSVNTQKTIRKELLVFVNHPGIVTVGEVSTGK